MDERQHNCDLNLDALVPLMEEKSMFAWGYDKSPFEDYLNVFY